MVWLFAACSHLSPQPPLPPGLPLEARAGTEVLVRADEAWTPTGIRVEPGQVVEFWAAGQVRIARPSFFGREGPGRVGPRGTYFYPNADASRPYPLAAASQGPAPVFALLGKVGENGRPFLVGEHRYIRVEEAGEILLGINDFDPSDNKGSFRVAVRLASDMKEPPPERVDDRPVILGSGAPQPIDDARVLIFFIDGLRYDALKEMAYAGYLPNIKRIFFEGGTDVDQTFTISPSNTVPATTAFPESFREAARLRAQRRGEVGARAADEAHRSDPAGDRAAALEPREGLRA